MALSGCSSAEDIVRVGDDAARVAEQVAEESPTETPESPEGTLPFSNLPVFNLDRTVTIEPWNYRAWPVDLQNRSSESSLPLSLEYTIIVRSGPNIDFLITDEEEYESMRNGENWIYSAESKVNTDVAEGSSFIEELRTVVFIVDNTLDGVAAPDLESPETVEVDIEMTIR